MSPSYQHQVLAEMFQHRPELAAEVIRDTLRQRLPTYTRAEVTSGDLTELKPTQYQADAVTVLSRDDRPVHAVVVEIQRHRDEDKRLSWPVYITTVRARFDCPTSLLVVCPDAAVATWCAKPIDIGHPGFTLYPWVLGPHQTPAVTEPEQALRHPELAVFSTLVHGSTHDPKPLIDAMLAALKTVGDERAGRSADMVLMALTGPAYDYLEAELSTETYGGYQSKLFRRLYSEAEAKGLAEGKAEGMAEGKAEGRAEGKADGVLAVLDARNVPIPDDVRRRINECTDLELLDAWIRRAAVIATGEELLAD
jgi:hypothetical protein